MTHKIRFWNSRFSKSKLALVMHMLIWGDALAAPIGGEIVGGSGSVTQQGAETTIVQSSDRLAIDWQAFDLGENERVEFIQPGKSAVALNRILSDKGSEILGRIDANGHVILVNPNGVVFGQGAVVNAGGLIASGLQINPDDFMNGDLIFKRIEATDGTVINSGLINAASGGNVALIGTQVENRGLISATLGSVTLASGAEAVLTFDDSGLLGVQVDKAVLQSELGDKAAITNAGELRAEGGRILLSASTTRDVFSQAVNWGEQKQARSVTYSEDGSFTLGAGGDVVNSGTITTSGSVAGDIVVLGENITHSGAIRADATEGRAGHVELHANTTTKITEGGETTANAEQGGDIKLLGQNVGLFDRAKVEAIGTNGGGFVLVGGDKEGQNQQVRNADFVYTSEESSLDVSASHLGDGGTAIIFAEDTARIYGNISARGGSQQGNGGFVETSGKSGFSIKSAPDISAENGNGGHWLIDPYSITVSAEGDESVKEDEEFTSGEADSKVGVDTIVTALEKGGDVTLKTGGEGGDIIISAEIKVDKGGNSTLNLLAHNNIIINENISATGSNALNLNLHANRSNKETNEGSVKFGTMNNGAVSIQSNGGDFKISGDNVKDPAPGANDPAPGANDPAPGAYNIDLTNLTIDVGGGNFVAHAENKLTRHQDFEIQDGNLTLGAAEWEFSAPGSRPALISTGNGNVIFFTGGELRLPSIKSAGDITLNVRDTKENGEFKVHNERQSGDERIEFSLGGTLTLNLGSQGSAEIHHIVAGDKLGLAIESGQNATLQTGAAIHLYGSKLFGDLTLTSGADITQEKDSAIKTEGNLRLYVGDNKDVTLNSAENILGTSVWVGSSAKDRQAGKVELNTSQDLNFGDDPMSLKGTLTATAGGSISQGGAISTSEVIILSAEKITLDKSDNNFQKLSIEKAESAKIVDSEGLELTAVDVLGKLELSGISTLTQSGALSVGELALNIDGATALSRNDNRIGTLSGSVQEGNIKVNGPLKIADFHFGGMWRREGYDLTIEQMQVEGVPTEGINASVNLAKVEVGNIQISGNANLSMSNFNEFLLAGEVKSLSSGSKTLTVNGMKEESSYEITKDASWQNIAFHINGGGAGVIKGPDLDATWIIQGDEDRQLSSTRGDLNFAGMNKLQGGNQDDTFIFKDGSGAKPGFHIDGGGGEDTLDYSSEKNLSSVTLVHPDNDHNGKFLSIGGKFNDIEILIGNETISLQAPDGQNDWTIGEAGNNRIVSSVGESAPPLRGMMFQGFTNLKGGSGVDNFIVQLDGQGTDGSIPNYELYGGKGESSLRIAGGTGDWTGKYGVSQNGHPEFIFSISEQERIKVGYQEIEDISLQGYLKQMEVKGRYDPEDQIKLSADWWQLNNFAEVKYDGGLQSLVIEGGVSGSISLVHNKVGDTVTDPNGAVTPPPPPKLIQFPDSLTLQNGTLSFDDGIELKATNLHLIGLQGDIGTIKSSLEISVETLKLKDNNGNIFIGESDGVTLAEVSGVGDSKSIDLKVKMGDLNQDGAITMSSGSLNLRAESGDVFLVNDNNEISNLNKLSASGSATVYTKGSLGLGEVEVENLTLRAEEGISSSAPVVVKGETRLVSGGNIRFDNRYNDFGSVPTEENNFGRVSIEGIGGNQVDVNLVDSNELRLAGVNISGDLVISAKKLSFNDLTIVGRLDVSAVEVVVSQLVLAKGDVVFNNPYNVTEATKVTGAWLIHSEHGLIFGVRTLTAADQMIEIETLAEIDPAIFTNVKNYFHQDVSVLLPADQRYDDSDEEDSLAEIDLESFTDVKNYSYQDVSVQLPLDRL